MSLKRILGWSALVGALILTLDSTGLLETSSLRAYNLLFTLRGAVESESPIVIVTIDEVSLDELAAPWPWPRAEHGAMLDILSQGKPLAIGLDIVFSEPSGYGAADDAAFSAAIQRAGNAVLAAAPVESMTVVGPKLDMNLPLPQLRKGAAGFGPVAYTVDPDANIRRAALSTSLAGQHFSSFLSEMYRVATKSGLPAKPLPPGESFLINYRGEPGSYDEIPYYQLWRKEISPEVLNGKIVLIGATTPILHDVFSTPFAPDGRMPGVEVHAHALETLFRGIPIHPVSRPIVAILVLLLAGAGAWISTAFRPLGALLFLTSTWTAMLVLIVAMLAWGTWLDIVSPSMALGIGYFGSTVEAFVREQRQSRRLSRFFSPAVLKEVVRARSDVNLGSSRRLLTVLFCDIRGFTPLSERLEPEEVAELLGEYLTDLTAVVFKHGGTVDKYVGDCIMALYNVPFEHPDHAKQAVRTAIEFQEHTRALSEKWKAKAGVELLNGVGISTGEAVVGTLGSRQRLEYTAIGDTVNLAARLETLTKDFDFPIIVSESTYALLNDEFSVQPLGTVTLKGKENPVNIYAVLTSHMQPIPKSHSQN
jgi:adenylate cyclase